MSVHVLSWVFKHSPETLGRRLVLLVLADKAEADGTSAWPSVALIAEEARLSERQVQYVLRELETSGAIVRTGRHRYEGQRHGTFVYDVVMKGANTAPFESPKGAESGTQRVQSTSPNPSLDPSLEIANAISDKREPDELWDALVAELGDVKTKTERGERNAALKELREVGATPEDVRARCRAYRRKWPEMALTASALKKHWSSLEAPKPRSPRIEVPDRVELTEEDRLANLERVRELTHSLGQEIA